MIDGHIIKPHTHPQSLSQQFAAPQSTHTPIPGQVAAQHGAGMCEVGAFRQFDCLLMRMSRCTRPDAVTPP